MGPCAILINFVVIYIGRLHEAQFLLLRSAPVHDLARAALLLQQVVDARASRRVG